MQQDCTTKYCYACGKTLPLELFHKNRNLKDGHCNRCKACTAAYARKRYQEKRDVLLAQSAQWSRENSEKRNTITRRWREQNQEYFVRYREDNHSERLAYNKRYDREHYAERQAYGRRYRQAHPEKGAATTRRYRARKRKADGNHTGEQFEKLVRHYGPRCLCCGKRRKLTGDHVVPLKRGGSNDIGNLQPLCGPCNSGKGAWHDTDYRPDGGAFARALIDT